MMNILIVEDEKALSHALELKLTHNGFTTTVVGNGRECLDAVAKGSFDVILLDLIMPEMDGFQVLEQLRKNGQTTPVFVLSNLGQRNDEERALAMGARRFFIKADTPLAAIVEAVKEI